MRDNSWLSSLTIGDLILFRNRFDDECEDVGEYLGLQQVCLLLVVATTFLDVYLRLVKSVF